MTATVFHRLALFFRLMLVAALWAYVQPAVSFAMHGGAAVSYPTDDAPSPMSYVQPAARG